MRTTYNWMIIANKLALTVLLTHSGTTSFRDVMVILLQVRPRQ